LKSRASPPVGEDQRRWSFLFTALFVHPNRDMIGQDHATCNVKMKVYP
jgi:hypothetical protein